MTRARHVSTLGVIALYWALLVAGMVLCLYARGDEPAALGRIWSGAVIGTVLGHGFALLRFRLRAVLAIAIVITAFILPPGTRAAFFPAALCAFWSLGDRAALVAFWFPTVLWMLPILDHAQPDSLPDDPGIAMLGALAIAFIVFLRLRETRRVALWREVSPAPIAKPGTLVVLRERTGARLVRTTWGIGASALAFAATAGLAPRLWHSEPTSGHAAPETIGLRCCPHDLTVEAPQARVKEYFDLGRGHATEVALRPGIDCRRCESLSGAYAYSQPPPVPSYGRSYASQGGGRPHLVAPEPFEPPAPSGYGGLGVATTSGSYPGSVAATSSDLPETAPAASRTYDPVPLASRAPQLDRRQYIDPPRSPAPIEEAPPIPAAPTAQAPAEVAPPQVAAIAPPVVAPPPIAPHAVALPTPPTPPSPVATAPAPGPVAAPHTPAPGSSLLGWFAIVFGALLASQLALLALRPIRRWITLRHLRRPFWDETVDQRVSNAWQLALVGLRDAGWRSHAQESPAELARRTGVDGIDRCGTILERARHGVGIDAGDLETIQAASDTAYRDARRRLGPVARAVSWLRWPLV